MGFTKLDDGIVYSSIMAEDDAVFKIFFVLLATCKKDGISPISEVFLTKITGKPINEITRILKILESPDPFSRSQEFEGRRIERVNGGFRLLNHGKYRAMDYKEHERERKRLKRTSSESAICPDNSGHFRKSPDKYASASVSEEGMQGEIKKAPPRQILDQRSPVQDNRPIIPRWQPIKQELPAADEDTAALLASTRQRLLKRHTPNTEVAHE